MNDPYGNQMTSICTMQVIEDNDTGAARTATIQLKSGETVLATYEITQPAADPKTEIYNVDCGPRPEADFDVTDQLTAEQWGIGDYELSFINLAYNTEGINPGMQISRSGVSKDYDAASGEGNLYFINAVPAAGLADGDLDPSFVIEIPEATISNATYLYINFGLWGRANYGKGNLVMDVVYSDGTTQSVTPSLNSASTWQYFENRIEVPAGVTSAAVKFYALDKAEFMGSESAASNFRIDDVNISVRSK